MQGIACIASRQNPLTVHGLLPPVMQDLRARPVAPRAVRHHGAALLGLDMPLIASRDSMFVCAPGVLLSAGSSGDTSGSKACAPRQDTHRGNACSLQVQGESWRVYEGTNKLTKVE